MTGRHEAGTVTSPDPQPVSLRVRARALVQAEITARAMELFAAQGFEATTVDQIARAAGVSARSFFRYFPTKEDVVVDDPADYVEHLRRVLEQRPADEAAWIALRETLRVRTAYWQAHPDLARQTVALLASSPALQARLRLKMRTWHDALVPNTAARLPQHDALVDMRASALVSAAIGCLDAAFLAWQRGPAATSLDDLFAAALDAVHAATDA